MAVTERTIAALPNRLSVPLNMDTKVIWLVVGIALCISITAHSAYNTYAVKPSQGTEVKISQPAAAHMEPIKPKVYELAATMEPVAPPPAPTNDPSSIAREVAETKYGWYGTQVDALRTLWGNEANWEVGRLNKSSLACGIPQSLPCTKIYPELQAGADKAGLSLDAYIRSIAVYRNDKMYLPQPDGRREVEWGLDYIARRYSKPSNALTFWLSRSPHWY